MKLLIIFFSFFLAAQTMFAQNLCAQFPTNSHKEGLLKELSTRLNYSYEEFCSNNRILAIYDEVRKVYYAESDEYHDHLFITLHYNEYSCEYQYDLNDRQWRDQHCYNTF